MKNKLYSVIKKNKKTILLSVIIFLLSLLFPYSGDDWQWSISKLSFSTIKNFSQDIYLNGRYLGNIFVILLTKNKIIRGLIITTTITFIIKIIEKLEKTDISLIAVLILLMPKEIFKQSIVWSSGFANYAISILFLLLCLINIQKLYNKKLNKKLIIPNILLYFFSGLFIENLTIFLLIFLVIINIYEKMKNKKYNINYIVCLLGSFLGGLTMFLHPTYIRIFKGTDGYRTIAESSGLIEKIMNNLTNSIFPYAINCSLIIFIIITIIFIIKIFKNHKLYNNKKIMLLITYNILYLTYILLSIINVDWKPLLNLSNIFYLITTIIFIISFIILIYYIYQEKSLNAILICLVIIGLLLPLLIVSPLGARNYLLIYILEIILLIDILRISNIKISKQQKYIINLIIIVALGFYTTIYGYITLIDYRRESYILEMSKNSNNNTIYLPKLPYNNYVWVPDFTAEYYANFYKIKRDVSLNVKFNFMEYSDWKTKYYKK